MSRPVYDRKEDVINLVGSLVDGGSRGFGNCTCIGAELQGELVGGAVFHNYSPESNVIEISSAGITPRWLSRKMLKAIFEYPFLQIGCRLVVLRVGENNKRMLSIAKRFGFDDFPIPNLKSAGVAEHIMTISKEKWLKGRFCNG